MDGLYFGTGGVPRSSRDKSTIGGIERINELRLGSMEIEFVQRVGMGEAGARLVADVARQQKVKLSAHAPYYINLNAHEPEKITASQGRLLQAAHIAWICRAESVVVHCGFYLGDSPAQAYLNIKKNLEVVLNQLHREDNKIWVRPEVMGKGTQFGTIEEALSLSTELEGVAPCLDFAHWHARTGKANSYSEFVSILLQVEKRLGRAALDNMHIHLSGIDYGSKGETNHRNLKESDFNYPELLQALKEHGVKGLVICESPNLEEDALLLQTTYQGL